VSTYKINNYTHITSEKVHRLTEMFGVGGHFPESATTKNYNDSDPAVTDNLLLRNSDSTAI